MLRLLGFCTERLLAEKASNMMDRALQILIKANDVTPVKLSQCKSNVLADIDMLQNIEKLPSRRTIAIKYRGCELEMRIHCLAEEFDLRWAALLKAEAVVSQRLHPLFVENSLVKETVPAARFKVDASLERDAIEARQMANNLLDPSSDGDAESIKETHCGCTLDDGSL